jgi:hypothetical protein
MARSARGCGAEAHRLQSDFIGDRDDKNLSPAKLATFYKAVGGNYDCAFLLYAPSRLSIMRQG